MKTLMFVEPSPQVAIRGLGLCVLTLPLLVLATGCSDGSAGSISGKVVYQNKPLQGGKLTFAHDKGTFYATIAEDGTYEVDKVPVGEVRIAVSSGGRSVAPPRPIRGKMSPQLEKKLTTKPAGNIAVPDRYRDPEKSGLTYEVHYGKQTHDIDLK